MKSKIIQNINSYKSGYKKRLEVSIITSLFGLMILFYMYPEFIADIFILPEVPGPEVVVINIPQTIQRNAKRPPRPATPAIPVPSEDIAILDDITLEIERIEDLIAPDKVFNPDELEGLPYLPRQVLEVLPGKSTDNPTGEIMLSLHIDKNGKVIDHKVLKNTTQSQTCLQSVVKAVYSSRWQPVVIDSTKYEYWIYKSYHFE